MSAVRGRVPPLHRLVAALLVVLASAPSCSLLGAGGGYELIAYFPRAVALYPESTVKVMGVDAGRVTDVVTEGNRVRVEITVDDGVPLPADVRAAIRPLTLIGERNIVLFPAWRPGEDRIADGEVIPLERTEIPVEPDEALRAFTDLARAIDPEAVAQLISSGARALDGQGAAINRALEEASTLTSTLASVDTQLLDAAESFHTFAVTLNAREEQLGRVISSFSQATDVLADERQNLAQFLSSVVRLTEEGNALLGAYQDQLPDDIAGLVELALLLQDNIVSLEQTIASFPDTQRGLLDAYDAENHRLVQGIQFSDSLASQFDALFDFDGDGASDIPLPCIPVLGGVNCPGVDG